MARRLISILLVMPLFLVTTYVHAQMQRAATIRVRIIAVGNPPMGIELNEDDYDQTIYASHTQGLVPPDECVGELHICVTTSENKPWQIEAESKGFEAGEEPYYLKMTTSIPTDINDEMPIPKGMTVKDEILNGVKTVYTAGENERRVDKLQLNGTLSVDRGDEVPKGEYNTKVVLTLVQ